MLKILKNCKSYLVKIFVFGITQYIIVNKKKKITSIHSTKKKGTCIHFLHYVQKINCNNSLYADTVNKILTTKFS